MEDKVFLDEAGLGEVGKVISKFYASKDDIKDLDSLKDFVSSHNEIKLHYITNEEYQKMYDEGKNPQLSDIHDPISIVEIDRTADSGADWADDPVSPLYGMGLNVERLLGGSSQKYLLFNITPNHKITSDRIDNVDFNAIPLKNINVRLQLAFGEKDQCLYWRFLINDDSNSEWYCIQDPYSRQWVDNLIKQMQDKANKSELPTKLSQLEEDETHRTVTDTEKNKWNLATNVVDNLESDDSTKPLSAKQGKILFQYANEGKEKIANALIGKGVDSVSKDSSFSDLAKGVDEVKTGYGVGDVINSENIAEIINKKELKVLFQLNITEKTFQQGLYMIEKDGFIYSVFSLPPRSTDKNVVYKTNSNGENEWVMRADELGRDTLIVNVNDDTNGNLYLSCVQMTNSLMLSQLIELSPLKEIVYQGNLPYQSNRLVDIDYNNCLYAQTDKTLIKTNSKREKIWEVDTKGYTATESVTNKNDMVFTLARQQNDSRKSALFIINQKGNIIFETYSSDTPYGQYISADNDGNFYYQQENIIYKITQTGEIMNSIKIERNVPAIVDKFGYIYTINSSNHIIKINQKAEIIWELPDLECQSLMLVGDNYIVVESNNSFKVIQNKKEIKCYKILH